LRDSNHIIGVYSDDISKKIQLIKRKTDKKGSIDKDDFLEFIQEISLVNEKINTLTKFTTKSGFLEARLSTTENIVRYIENYVKNIYGSLHKEMTYEFSNSQLVFEKEFQPIELSVVLDNILNNSKKKGASTVIFDFKKENKNLILSIKDIGKKLDNSIAKELIFEEGITSTKGSGLGLSHVKRILEKDFNASVEYNPNYTNGFELIIKFI
jgi:signal transduction histidine kinase